MTCIVVTNSLMPKALSPNNNWGYTRISLSCRIDTTSCFCILFPFHCYAVIRSWIFNVATSTKQQMLITACGWQLNSGKHLTVLMAAIRMKMAASGRSKLKRRLHFGEYIMEIKPLGKLSRLESGFVQTSLQSNVLI